MRRTGKKQVIRELRDTNLYVREYECTGCGQYWLYNEDTNFLSKGFIE